MIFPGLVSITFRKLSPEQIIELVRKAGLSGIEWGGDIHVPHGDIARAKEVKSMTKEAGLRVAVYGSYYHLCKAKKKNCPSKKCWKQALRWALRLSGYGRAILLPQKPAKPIGTGWSRKPGA